MEPKKHGKSSSGFNNLRAMDSAGFELIARLDQLDDRPSMESMHYGCNCFHVENQHMINVECYKQQADICIE